jgi:cephalosporin hydroxylase
VERLVAEAVTDAEIIRAFHGLYAGGLAQQRRAAGDSVAMPPWNETQWLGCGVVKCPMDLWVYQEIIYETRPDILLECGTSGGGSAFYFATLFDLLGGGRVLTVDKDEYRHLWREHPRITYLVGDSVSDAVVARMRAEALQARRVMVSLDSDHAYAHAKRELDLYGPLVTAGCYMVCEDAGFRTEEEDWVSRSISEFLRENANFAADASREKHLLTNNRNGWMRRIS